MLIPAAAPPGRAPPAATALPLAVPTGPPPSDRGMEPRGALIVVEIEIYVGPAPGG